MMSPPLVMERLRSKNQVQGVQNFENSRHELQNAISNHRK